MIKNSLLKISSFVLLIVTCTIMNAQNWHDMINEDHVNYYEVVKRAEKYYASRDTGKGSGYKLYQRWKYFAGRMMDDNGVVPTQSDQLEALREFYKKSPAKKGQFNGDWAELGPFAWSGSGSWNPGVGRITAIAVEKNQQQLLFAGSPGGGIWRSRNAGQKWEPVGDQLNNMHVYGIGIDPFDNNVVYHLNGAGRIMKSTNQGNSWREIFNTGRGVGNAMSFIFHPNNRGVFMVASSAGVFKTTNSGASFTKVLNQHIEDIAYKPGQPNVVYACGRRFYKSTNGGNSFVRKSAGIVSEERMRMAVTPARNNYVYLVQKSGSSFGHFYRSTNSGEGFAKRSANNPPFFTQAWRDMAIMVSSTNAEEVHVAGMNNHRSRNGGNSFTELAAWSAPGDPSYIHADVEVMMCVNDVFYAGTDGGIYRSRNHGDNYTDLSSLGGLAVHQFYRIGGTPQDPGMMIGGSQDNGVNLMKNKNKTWNAWLGADGMECFIDPTNKNIVYGMTQNGGMNKSNNGGRNRVTINKPVDGNGNWVTPFFVDPSRASNIYAGYDGLYRSKDRGITWSKISRSVNTGGNIDEATIAPSDNRYIYMAKGDRFWRTKNGQADNPTWELRNGFAGNVNFIAVDPNNPARVAIACNGSRVYISNNAGDTWINKKMNLPNAGAECVAFDNKPNNGLYVGTNNAIFYTNYDINSWLPFSKGLPPTSVRDLEINFQQGIIRAGTHGRGMLESHLYGDFVSPSKGLVTLYQHCNYDGFSGGLKRVGDYKLADLEKIGVSDDWVSSIEVMEGFKAILFENNNFTGASIEITSDMPCNSEWNDRASSIRVRPNGVLGLNGTYYLQNRVSGLFLDVAGGEVAVEQGVNVHQWSFTGTKNQQFKLEHLNNGSYRVRAVHSDKVLDVDGVKLNNGANIHQWTYLGSDNQKWIVIPSENKYFRLVAQHIGKILEVAGCGTNNQDNVQQYDNNNQLCGQWRLIPVDAVTGTGTGLRAQYYNGNDFNDHKLTRVDKQVNMDWEGGSPDQTIDNDNFSVRWTGSVQAKYSGEHTFHINADDGRKLWVDGELLIDDWSAGSFESSGKKTLTAGQIVNMRIDYYEGGGNAKASFSWETNLLPKEVIPESQLYPNELPSVTITDPTSNEIFFKDETISVNINASDNISVNKVELYDNSELIGTKSAAPYTFQLSGLDDGDHTLSAKAYDSQQAVNNSDDVEISVSQILNLNDKSVDNSITIYPNPARENIHVNTQESFDQIDILDVHGNSVISTDSNEIDIRTLDSGVYIIEVISGNNITKATFVKQ